MKKILIMLSIIMIAAPSAFAQKFTMKPLKQFGQDTMKYYKTNYESKEAQDYWKGKTIGELLDKSEVKIRKFDLMSNEDGFFSLCLFSQPIGFTTTVVGGLRTSYLYVSLLTSITKESDKDLFYKLSESKYEEGFYPLDNYSYELLKDIKIDKIYIGDFIVVGG